MATEEGGGGGSEEEEVNDQHILRITDIAEEPLEILLPIDGYEEMPLVSLEEAVEKLVHILPRVQTYAHVAKERCKKPIGDLTQDESASIMLYTMGWAPLDKCLYVVLNATLRSKDRGKLKPWFLYLRLLFNALFRLPSITRTVFRGVKLDLSEQYVKENTIIWWGFSSCTVAMGALRSEQFLGKTSIRTMFTIECLNGKDIRKYSYYSSEGEILVLPVTEFKIIDSLDQGDLKMIHLQEIVSRFPRPCLQPVPSPLECSLVSSLHNSSITNKRKAIDSSGRIGSFYNVYRDCLVKLPRINFEFNENQVPPLTKCMIERGDKIECQNLLQFIDINDELRLSIVSDIVLPTGIASVIEYPYLIDERTRVLYFSHTIRQEYLPINLENIRKSIKQSTSKGNATHIVTSIDIGIDLIVILRITSGDSKTINNTLDKIRESLINDTKLSGNISLDGILCTHIYSNIHYLTQQKTLIDLYNEICKIKNNVTNYRPCNYILHPIDSFLQDNNKNWSNFIPLKSTIVQKVEQYFYRFSWINKMWLTTLHTDKSIRLNNNLEEQLREVQKQLSRLNEQYENEKKQFQRLILNIRQGKDSEKSIEHKILNENNQKTLSESIDDSIYSITILKERRFFINDMIGRGFQYHNANKYRFQKYDNENIIQQKLTENNPNLRFICSNDTLNKNNNNLLRLEQLCSTLLNEKTSNPYLRLIYVDFTYSSYELDQIKLFPLVNSTKDSNICISSLRTKEQISIDNNNINILLLGRSGVGKSALINTFINYLKFKDYENTQSNRFLSHVHVLIPFVRSSLCGLEEHLVQFGVSDHNEDNDHPDQSITQQCKLYNFNLTNNKKLCIIDTPGFGNIHNQDNDDRNMQHILSHVINLTHLNAICVIVQSDNIQFDDYQLCLTKLFDCIGNNAAKNIVFCFTKVLSKSIDKRRNDLIKLMLESLHIPNIPFNENTIFNFDSEFFLESTMSHRFTSASNSPNQISDQSWKTSKLGWDRLLNYIRGNLDPYSIQQGLQKDQSARLEINQLIRPLLETIRNNMRNSILSKTGYHNCSIELHPLSLLHPSAICYSCRRIYCHHYGDFCIIDDSPHDFGNNCKTCSCDPHQHLRTDYRLKYEYVFNETDYRSVEALTYREDLLRITVNLTCFILQGNQTTNNNPFLSYLNKMIDEERTICEKFPAHKMNLALYNQLLKFKHEYQEQIDAIKQKHLKPDFDIDDIIENAKQIPTVKIQLDAAKKIQETFI